MRLIGFALLIALPGVIEAQRTAPSSADSALIGRVLLAEDRRDSADAAIRDGMQSADAIVRTIATRAIGRMRDPRFAMRDSLPVLPPPPSWPEPAWRLRLRALAAQKTDCAAIRGALADSVWPVRLLAADLIAPPCAGEAERAMLRSWVDALPADASRRQTGGVSWHAAAHGAVALARVSPNDARQRLVRLSTHRQWQVRMYSARAAALLADTSRLRALALDTDDNVRDVAIGALSELTHHADDDFYLAALRGRGAQAARAGALALKGSLREDVREAAWDAYRQWASRDIASARDARVALLEAAGRPASDDQPPAPQNELLPQVVALALGQDVRLRVTMAPASGGGSFVVRLRGDVAPLMASRILALARAHYYDGLTWHRVEHDFVIQGGSPGASEYVGLAAFMRDEVGSVPHLRGTVGMSTRGHDTGDAQWFVNLKDNLRLGRDYTVFAEVVRGIEVVDGVLEGDTIASIEVVTPSDSTG